jgi:hypothetical protein
MNESFLNISFAHVPVETYLENLKPYIIAQGDESIFIDVPEVIDPNMPIWLYYVMALAKRENCHGVRIEAGGIIWDCLKKFNWD